MPDTYTRGKLNFTKEVVVNANVQKPLVKIMEFDCLPPPAGSTTNFNPSLTDQPTIDASFLQRNEERRLLEAAKNANEQSLSLAQLVQDMSTAFNFRSLSVDLNNIPAEWKRVVACFKATIYYDAFYEVFDVTARATQDIQIDNENFPSGDMVAAFRVIAPTGAYQFRRSYEYNPRCCDQPPARPGDDYSDIFRRRPSSDIPFPYYWKPKLSLEYKFDFSPSPEKKSGEEGK
ncbi:MAG: hypothetical protein HYV04_08460 [Deltaproteobacteria bacterium]|nr:hypothetical protein [Deltaproteobacteria bacterium]